MQKVSGVFAIWTIAGLAAAAQGEAQTMVSHTPRAAVPPQSLATALQVWAGQTGWQLMYDPGVATGHKSNGAIAGLPAIEALDRILEGTGLSRRFVNDRTVSIFPISKPSASRVYPAAYNRPMRLAEVSTASDAGGDSADGADPSGRDKSRELGEVIVTATKREERVEDIPVSIAVIGNQDIERRGLIGMQDYLRSIPGVNQIDRGSKDNSIVIRGITTQPDSENSLSGATVGSYFDETPITGAGGFAAGGIDVRPVDIDRIEILRGPQGTAFGSSSLGGTLRMIPTKPKLDGFSMKAQIAYSDTGGAGSDNSMIQGVVNIPVVEDTFALRAVGYRYDESGFYRNVASADPGAVARATNYGLADYVNGFTQNDVGQIISTGGRLAGLWKPTDKLNLSFNFLTQKIEQDGNPVASVGKYEQALLPVAPQGRVRGEAGDISDTNMDLVNAVLNYDLGWGTLTAAGSWVNGDSAIASDLWEGFPFPGSATYANDFESYTGETRVASQLDGRFQFLAGLYFENVKEGSLSTVDWPGDAATNPLTLFGLPVTNPLLLQQVGRDRDQRAVFGEVSYDLTDKLTATVGGRFFKYDKDESSLREGGFAGLPIGGGTPSDFDSDESDSSFKANVSYEPVKDALVYASWAEGFRLGKPQAGLSPGLCDQNNDGLVDNSTVSIESTQRVDSDFLENYEIGTKFALFNRRMAVDASVYHIKWDGLPITTFVTCSPIGYTANAGAATSDGIELQASVFVADGLRVDLGGGYTKAELSEDAPGLGAQDGARLPGSPKFSANLAAQYDFNLSGHNAFVRADSVYTGKFYGDLLESPGTEAGGYTKIDARAGVAVRNLSVELFVRNLTNEDAFTWRTIIVGNTNPFLGYRLRPRTVGIQLGYSFQ